MRKRSRWERTLHAQPVDRPPVMLWRHWPGDDETAGALAAITLRFQQIFDWDVLILSPANDYPVQDYDEHPRRAPDHRGLRPPHLVVTNPEDWEKITPLPIDRGTLGMTVHAAHLVRHGVGPSLPLLHVLYSPWIQAYTLAGTALLRHLTQAQEQVKRSLHVLQENTLRLMERLFQKGIDGILYVVDRCGVSSEMYAQVALPFDQSLVRAARERGYVLLHVHDSPENTPAIQNLPVHAVGWHELPTSPVDLPLMAGPSPHDLAHASPMRILRHLRQMIRSRAKHPLIVMPMCVTELTTPTVNIRALRAAVELKER